MIHAGRRRRQNGSGNCVGDPLPVSVFCSSFCFLLCSSPPIRALIAWVGVDDFARMIHAGRKMLPNGQGSWVEFPLPVCFFCSVLLPPYAHQLPVVGWMVSPSAPIHFFFILLFLSFFLALLRADSAVAG